MTALSANTALQLRNRNGQTTLDGVILTAAVIYQHAMVVRTAAGLLKPADTDTTTKFVGLAEIENPDDDTAGLTGDGTLRANCIGDIEALMVLVTAITVGNVGSAAYAADDATISVEATLGPEVGVLTEFVATNSGWVRFHAKALAAGT